MSTQPKKSYMQLAGYPHRIPSCILAIQAEGADKDIPGSLQLIGELHFEAADASKADELPKFRMTANTGVPMRLRGFFDPVIIDLSGSRFDQDVTPVIMDHDTSQRVGHTTEQKITDGKDGKITARGVVSSSSENAKGFVTDSKRGFPFQTSVGADIEKAFFVPEDQNVKVNGREWPGPLIVASKTRIRELTVTTLGADSNTSARVAASLYPNTGVHTMGPFETWVASLGLDAATLPEDQKTKLKASYDERQSLLALRNAAGSNPPPNGNGQGGNPPPATQPGNNGGGIPITIAAASDYQPLSDIMAGRKAERERVQKITELTAGALDNTPSSQYEAVEALSRLAIDQNWDVKEYELQLLRAQRPTMANFRPRARQDDGNSPEVLQAALCMAAKLKDGVLEKEFDERVLDAAYKRRGLGLQELILTAAREQGCPDLRINVHNLPTVLRLAFPPLDMRASGFSTISIPNILSTTANKILVEAFNNVESVWRTISAIEPVQDFKTINGYSLTGDLTYEKIGPAGEIKHGVLGELAYSNKADTYAKMLAITRQDIINDDLGAFLRIPRRLGRGGALAINDIFWAVFLNNLSFFTVGRANYDSGGDTAFDSAGLDRITQFFNALTDPDGKPLGALPKILLVPPGHKMAARRLMTSPTTNKDTEAGVSNVWAGAYQVESSQYMSNSSFTGYSATAYYLLADPNDIPAVQTVFLNGQESPTVESADADFNVLGIQFRAYHDFGVALQEYRSGVRFEGA